MWHFCDIWSNHLDIVICLTVEPFVSLLWQLATLSMSYWYVDCLKQSWLVNWMKDRVQVAKFIWHYGMIIIISMWFEHCLYRSFRQRTRSLVLTQLMRFVVIGYFVRFKKLMLKFGILWVSSSAKLVPVGFKRVEANSSPETVQVIGDLIDFSLESVSCSNGNTCLVCIGGRHRTSGHIGRRVEWSPALHPP